MNIGLFGYGRMGKEVEAVAVSRSHSVVAIADVEHKLADVKGNFTGTDVIIDFSAPSAVMEHISFAAELGKPIIVGTTGWQNQFDRAKKIVLDSGIVAVVAPNFSIGVNLFISTVEKAAGMFGHYEDFDCAVLETHHNQKADSPSGTAITIGNAIIMNFPSKKKIRPGSPDGRIAKEELQVNSMRVGKEFGTHTVIFDSDFDRVEMTHTSRGRRGFALGAIMAAEWAIGKKGFYQFRDILDKL